MAKKKYVMFIDETGTSDLMSVNEPFTLTGVVFEYKYSVDSNDTNSPLKQLILELKRECFDRTDLALHLDHISKGKGQFAGIEMEKRKKFYKELPNFLSKLECHIISVTVDKNKLQQYYEPSKDPYVVAFTHVLQNFYSLINSFNAESARIVIESRDDFANLAVQKAFFDVFNNGTTHLNIKQELRDKIKGFIVASKTDLFYQSGLEIADLVCNPLSRVRRGLIEANPKCMNPKEYGSENRIFASIKEKIYSASNLHDFRNWGFKKVPIVKKKRAWIDNPIGMDRELIE